MQALIRLTQSTGVSEICRHFAVMASVHPLSSRWSSADASGRLAKEVLIRRSPSYYSKDSAFLSPRGSGAESRKSANWPSCRLDALSIKHPVEVLLSSACGKVEPRMEVEASGVNKGDSPKVMAVSGHTNKTGRKNRSAVIAVPELFVQQWRGKVVC